MKLGLGTVQLGTEYGVANKSGKPDSEYAVEILKTAYDRGITCYDTAAAYGESEKIIGRFIRKHQASPQICSKFLSPETADAELKSTLDNLGVAELDYYMLHGAVAVFKDGVGFEKSLSMIKETGKVKKTGVSVYSPDEILECIKYKNVDVLQVPFNIIDNRLLKSQIFSRLKDMGVEIHVRSIYLQGLLLMDSVPDYLQDFKPYKSELGILAEKLNLSVKALAFLYVRECGFVDKMFVGCENITQVLENAALYAMPVLDKSVVIDLQGAFNNVAENILNPARWQRKGV